VREEECRADGRTADQMRPLKITPDYISTAEGSVLIELGKTRVICTASVMTLPHFMKGSGKGGLRARRNLTRVFPSSINTLPSAVEI